jgi:hypothetical protein
MKILKVIFPLILSSFAFGQGSVATFTVQSPNGGVIAGASVALCSTLPNGTTPCGGAALQATFTDVTMGTPCTINPTTLGPLNGPGCTNPGVTDNFGNGQIFAAPGIYYYQTYGYGIASTYINILLFPIFSGGGGGGGVPGGVNTQVQYNNFGAFAGSAFFTVTPGTSTVNVTNLAISTSATFPGPLYFNTTIPGGAPGVCPTSTPVCPGTSTFGVNTDGHLAELGFNGAAGGGDFITSTGTAGSFAGFSGASTIVNGPISFVGNNVKIANAGLATASYLNKIISVDGPGGRLPTLCSALAFAKANASTIIYDSYPENGANAWNQDPFNDAACGAGYVGYNLYMSAGTWMTRVPIVQQQLTAIYGVGRASDSQVSSTHGCGIGDGSACGGTLIIACNSAAPWNAVPRIMGCPSNFPTNSTVWSIGNAAAFATTLEYVTISGAAISGTTCLENAWSQERGIIEHIGLSGCYNMGFYWHTPIPQNTSVTDIEILGGSIAATVAGGIPTTYIPLVIRINGPNRSISNISINNRGLSTLGPIQKCVYVEGTQGVVLTSIHCENFIYGIVLDGDAAGPVTTRSTEITNFNTAAALQSAPITGITCDGTTGVITTSGPHNLLVGMTFKIASNPLRPSSLTGSDCGALITKTITAITPTTITFLTATPANTGSGLETFGDPVALVYICNGASSPVVPCAAQAGSVASTTIHSLTRISPNNANNAWIDDVDLSTMPWATYGAKIGEFTQGAVMGATFDTLANCAAVGTAASPSIAACGAACGGSFSCDPAATGAQCRVTTSCVSANSQIFVQEDESQGTRLGVTCNTGTNVLPTSRLINGKTASTSFTINLGTVTTNPGCFDYFIINND